MNGKFQEPLKLKRIPVADISKIHLALFLYHHIQGNNGVLGLNMVRNTVLHYLLVDLP